eukprot:441985_1
MFSVQQSKQRNLSNIESIAASQGCNLYEQLAPSYFPMVPSHQPGSSQLFQSISARQPGASQSQMAPSIQPGQSQFQMAPSIQSGQSQFQMAPSIKSGQSQFQVAQFQMAPSIPKYSARAVTIPDGSNKYSYSVARAVTIPDGSKY